jgi:F0F1-type ATP synthase alpha subunit
MKFKSATTTLTAAIVGSAACFQFPAPTQAWVATAPTLQRPGRNTVRTFHSSSSLLKSAVTEEKEAVSPSSTPKGETIAEGSIVSMFPGGMSAVRINDDWTDSLSRTLAAPKTTALKPGAAKAAASKGGSLAGDLQGRTVVFPNGSVGVVVAHRPPVVYVYSDKDPLNDKDGEHVKILETMSLISTSSGSSVVDCFGRPDDPLATTSGKAEDTLERAIFAPIPQVKDIALINNPMLTGITMIDALAPIGRGQNMLMIGHDLDEMRGFTIDFLKTQVLFGNNTKCVYAAIDDKSNVLQRLRDAGIQDDVHVVAATKEGQEKTDASKAAEAVAIAGSACAIGEAYALNKGMNAVVVIDTIDQHKSLWDVTTRVLVDVFGIDSVVKSDREGGASSEMRAFYSSLVQRSSQYKVSRGGGSVTLLLLTTIPRTESATDSDTIFAESDFALSGERILDRIKMLSQKNIPLTAATLRKLKIPVPTESEGKRRMVLQHMDELISMSDGQIWLDERLEAAGQQPPMDPQRSLTRIGIGADTDSRADAPALRNMVEGLRLLLAQGAHMEGAEVNNASKKQIRTQNSLLLAMHQSQGSGGRLLSESCIVLTAALQGYLDDTVEKGHLAGTEEGERVIEGLLEYVRTNAPSAVAEIDKTLELRDEVKGELTTAMKAYFESLSL